MTSPSSAAKLFPTGQAPGAGATTLDAKAPLRNLMDATQARVIRST
jgi:hypothetical protein